MKRLYYNMQQLDDNTREMQKMDSKEKIRQKINEMLDKIETDELLNRIYRFIKYIYIHRT